MSIDMDKEKIVEKYIPIFYLLMSSINASMTAYYLLIDFKPLNALIFISWGFIFYLMAILVETWGLRLFKE